MGIRLVEHDKKRVMCKIAILENYSLFCSGIKPVLEKIEEFEIVAEERKVSDLLPKLKEANPDVIIIDVIHCDKEGILPVKKIRRKSAKIPILLIVDSDYSSHFEDYIALGINGLVFSDSKPQKLISAVRDLRKGQDYFPQKVWIIIKDLIRKRPLISKKQTEDITGPGSDLSGREISVLKLFCKGYTYKEIGAALHISPRTVETHKKNISVKLNVKSTAEMVEYAFQNNVY